jgi:Cu-processing system ATP-binding protein
MLQQVKQRQLAEAPPIELTGVSKSYGDACVLNSVDLQVAAGESLVLVGHNGAGKTTLMKLLLGLIRPSAGRVSVFGGDPTSAAAVARRAALGYLPESIVFDEAMTGRELLRFYASLKGVNVSSCDDLFDRVGIAEAADRRLGTWSKGMRQRLGLAQAILGKPRLLLLDEPTSGLDPSLRSTLYEIVETLRADGTTVLISSHALNEVEDHADRVAIMQQGNMLACGTLSELTVQAALPVRLSIRCEEFATARVAGQLRGKFGQADIGSAEVKQLDSMNIEIVCAQSDKMATLRQIGMLGDAIVDIDIRIPRLDDIYAQFTAGASLPQASGRSSGRLQP